MCLQISIRTTHYNKLGLLIPKGAYIKIHDTTWKTFQMLHISYWTSHPFLISISRSTNSTPHFWQNFVSSLSDCWSHNNFHRYKCHFDWSNFFCKPIKFFFLVCWSYNKRYRILSHLQLLINNAVNCYALFMTLCGQ